MIPFITSPVLEQLPHINHGFFTREGGTSTGDFKSLNVTYDRGDAFENVKENRRRVCETLRNAPHRLVTINQVHSSKVLIVTEPFKSPPPEGDALVTNVNGLTLGIFTADCVPILLADSKTPVIAAVHSGWKGALSDVIDNTLIAMQELGTNLKNIHAAIGPCIWQEFYEVGPEFQQLIAEDFLIPSSRPDHYLFDLPGYVTYRLKQGGVSAISPSPFNTYAHPERFFSYRRKTHLGEKNFGNSLSTITLC